MATMIPPDWADINRSHAEKHIYRKLRDETPDDWYAIHSLGLTSHSHKSWAEIDFVVVGPFGVICVEVKGGRITVEHGQWATNDHTLGESPYSQAGGGAAALRRELREVVPRVKRALVEYGVAFPDVEFTATGPGIEPEITYDARDVNADMETFLRRVEMHWRNFRDLDDDRFRPLSRAERSAAVAWLAPTFDFVPSMQSRIADAEAELVRLTETQAVVLRAVRTKPRALIRGGAGTGKTLLAVDEASRLATQDRQVLVLCRSRHLKIFLDELLDDEPLIRVEDFESLAWDLVDRAGMRESMPDAEHADLLTVFLPDYAAQAAIDLGEADTVDALIIDEAQDLLFEGALDLIDMLLTANLAEGTWRVFLDHKQNVFSAVDAGQYRRVTDAAVSELDLVDNCRNTPQVAVTTSMLAAVPLDELLAPDGPEVDFSWALDPKEELENAALMLERWIRKGISPEKIVVLGETTEPPSAFLKALGSNTPVPVPWRERERTRPAWSAVDDFKGLEASAVIMTGIRSLSSRESLRKVYVGCSRARTMLGIVLDERLREEFNLRAVEFGKATAKRNPN